MIQDPIRLADVIERVEKLEEEDHCSPSRVFESIKETRNRIEALEKLADDRHKAYGVMFVNLQKQIELLTIKTRNSISGLGDNQSKLWKSRK